MFNLENKLENVHNIKSKKLKLYTTKGTKIGLSPYDDKFHMLIEETEDNTNIVHKLAYGHYKINWLFVLRNCNIADIFSFLKSTKLSIILITFLILNSDMEWVFNGK